MELAGNARARVIGDQHEWRASIGILDRKGSRLVATQQCRNVVQVTSKSGATTPTIPCARYLRPAFEGASHWPAATRARALRREIVNASPALAAALRTDSLSGRRPRRQQLGIALSANATHVRALRFTHQALRPVLAEPCDFHIAEMAAVLTFHINATAVRAQLSNCRLLVGHEDDCI